MQKKIAISLSLSVLISIVALYLAFRNVPLRELYQYLKIANYWWLIPAVVVIVLTFVLRVFRWQLILRSARPIPFWPAFHPLMIGFMMNCILPGRVGELARPVLLKQQRRIPMATGFATVAAERLFDIVVLILLFTAVFGTISSKPDVLVHFGSRSLSHQTLQSAAAISIRMGLLLLAILVLFTIPQVRNAIVRLLTALACWTRLTDSRFGTFIQKVVTFGTTFIDHFAQGLSLVSHPMRLAGCAALTAMIWALTVLIYYLVAQGFPGLELTLWQWTTVMVIVCFFIALPSVPGFWGLWEAGGVFALSLFNIGNQAAVGFTLVNHAIQIIPVILIGLLSALIASVNILQLGRLENDPAQNT